MTMSQIDGRTTFADYQKLYGPDGKMLPVAEVLNQTNVMLQDAPMTKSNAKLGHRVDFRTALPTVTTGKFNQGIPKSKATTEQHNESMALFVGRVETDIKFKDQLGEEDFNIKRAKDALAFAEAFSQKVSQALLYGSVVGDESSFDGFTVRMPNLQRPLPGQNGSQVLSNGAVAGGDGTSILVVDWHPDRGCHLIFPKDAKNSGLWSRNLGDPESGLPVNDADNNSFQAAVTEWYWSVGLAVEDPRRMARLCNVDISDAAAGAQATQAQIIASLIELQALMPSPAGFQRVAYMHPLLISAFEKQLMFSPGALRLTLSEYLGEKVPHLGAVPFRRMDQFSISEGPVS